MVLNQGILTSFKTENQNKATEVIDLKIYGNVCKGGNLDFYIYKQSKVAFAFKANNSDEKDKWVEYL